MAKTAISRPRKSRAARIVAIAMVAVLAIPGAYVFIARKTNAVARDGIVYIPTGSDFEAMVDTLVSNGMLVSEKKFRTEARIAKLTERVRPGRYELRRGVNNKSLVRMFFLGYQKPVRVTFNNIRTPDRLAGAVSRYLEPDSLAFLHEFNSDSMARSFGFDRRTLMALFIPNTYEMYWTTSPYEFVARMKREYDKFWNAERLEKLAATGLTQIQAITLASIVYEETKRTDEMPVIAGVYLNRLRTGMKLQACPTAKFAVGDFTLRRLLEVHTQVDSPYNTYLYAGLPPGPICMPSIAAIDAVLENRKHNYLYFCAKDDLSGVNVFSTSLAEHNRKAARYQSELNRMGIKK